MTVVNCQNEKYDIFIGRMHSGNEHFGNPFIIGQDGQRQVVIEKFEEWLSGSAYMDVEPERRKWIIANLSMLKGKRLGCFCAPKSCHGDILEEFAEM
jgi:hypothetical protein